MGSNKSATFFSQFCILDNLRVVLATWDLFSPWDCNPSSYLSSLNGIQIQSVKWAHCVGVASYLAHIIHLWAFRFRSPHPILSFLAVACLHVSVARWQILQRSVEEPYSFKPGGPNTYNIKKAIAIWQPCCMEVAGGRGTHSTHSFRDRSPVAFFFPT